MAFKWVKMKESASAFMKALGIDKIEVKDKEVLFSGDQREAIDQKFGTEVTAKVIEEMNKEIAASVNSEEDQQSLNAILKELELSSAEDNAEGATEATTEEKTK